MNLSTVGMCDISSFSLGGIFSGETLLDGLDELRQLECWTGVLDWTQVLVLYSLFCIQRISMEHSIKIHFYSYIPTCQSSRAAPRTCTRAPATDFPEWNINPCDERWRGLFLWLVELLFGARFALP